MEKLKYIIEDNTIAQLLGVQNFSTDEAAVLELVKNAYDAKALNLKIEFLKDSIVFFDDGFGMDNQDIKKLWMHVGKSNKEYIVLDSNDVERVQAGSKGVGRFALARLGENVTVQSKKIGKKGVIWKTDWNKSIVDEVEPDFKKGTRIYISGLRSKWGSKRVKDLVNYLGRTYNDTAMKIEVCYEDKIFPVTRLFPKAKAGVNCKSNIRLCYENGILTTNVYSDEFSDKAKDLCEGIDLQYYSVKTDMKEELKGIKLPEADSETIDNYLLEIGSFSADLFFNIITSKLDNEKFYYKQSETPSHVEDGIVLYRNAFSISSYEGKKDWLGLGKRSRKSPAAASHPTGSWRVRENQLSGFVEIDKRKNEVLRDLSNRQGLDENVYFKLFVEIILTGIKEFERYRQNIIRRINSKNEPEDEKPTPVIERLIKNPKSIKDFDENDANQLKNEIVSLQKLTKLTIKDRKDSELRYKYDVRILNVLATTGLKTSSIAHEFINDRNSIEETYCNVVDALKEYDMWETLNAPQNTKIVHRNVPYLLEQNYSIANKLVVFMDTMLAEVEKRQFELKVQNVAELAEKIKQIWQRDYGWITIELFIDPFLEFSLSEDVLQVILDNLILNSVQQNEKAAQLAISVIIKERNGELLIDYSDNGRGLDKKYADNPMKILEVHETTRTNGHGLGMWIVNNSVVMSGGEILEINGNNGFSIKLTIGGKNNAKQGED